MALGDQQGEMPLSSPILEPDGSHSASSMQGEMLLSSPISEADESHSVSPTLEEMALSSSISEPDDSHFDSPTNVGTAGSSAASTKSRKGRGKAKNKSLARYLEQSNGKRPKVDIPEGLLKPVGNWSKEFTTEVGIICRTHAPVTCAKWKFVKEKDKQLIYKHILEKFDIDVKCPRIKHAVDKYLAARFKGHRHNLHKHYKKYNDHEVGLQHPFENVDKEDWKVCCAQFGSDSYKKVSKANTNNRGQLKVNHCAGSKSFVRFQHELQDSESEQPVGQIEFWKKTHLRRGDKGWTTPMAQQIHEQMISLQSQTNSKSEEEIFVEVLGEKQGYVRGLGHGKMASSLSSAQVGVSQAEEANKRAMEAEKRASELTKQLEAHQTELRATKSQLYVTQTMVDEMKSRQEQMEALIESMMSRYTGEPPSSPW